MLQCLRASLRSHTSAALASVWAFANRLDGAILASPSTIQLQADATGSGSAQLLLSKCYPLASFMPWRGMKTEAEVETRASWSPAKPASSLNKPSSESGSFPSSASSASASGADTMNDPDADLIAKVLALMGLQPGRNCVVGDGVATVGVGLFIEGKQIAVLLDASLDVAGPHVGSAKQYAQQRTQQRVLQTFGWLVAGIPEMAWRSAPDDHARIHLLVDALKQTLGKGDGGGGHHHHHGGCGCH